MKGHKCFTNLFFYMVCIHYLVTFLSVRPGNAGAHRYCRLSGWYNTSAFVKLILPVVIDHLSMSPRDQPLMCLEVFDNVH